MAKKIKITESQLKMILKNKAINEAALGEEPQLESNDFNGFDVQDGKFIDEPENEPSFDDTYVAPEEEGDGDYPEDGPEPIDYTMGNQDDPNMMPNPPREINLDLNEGQLKLKNEFNKLIKPFNTKGLSGEIKNKSKK
jgi:hypothetical protein